MSKFSRSWILNLKTDREGFKNAFFKVVKSRDYNVPRSGKIDLGFWVYVFQKYNIGEDCWGSVYIESFNIHKLTSRGFENRLDGKMKENANGLDLELHLPASYFEFLRCLRGGLLGVFLFYFFYYLLYKPLHGQSFQNPLWLTCFIVPAAVIGCWAGYKVQQRYMEKLKRDFTAVLKEIEKHAVNDKGH